MKTLVRYAASVNEDSNQTWDPVQHHPNLALGWLCERPKAAVHPTYEMLQRGPSNEIFAAPTK
jgi:hypothetical protein